MAPGKLTPNLPTRHLATPYKAGIFDRFLLRVSCPSLIMGLAHMDDPEVRLCWCQSRGIGGAQRIFFVAEMTGNAYFKPAL